METVRSVSPQTLQDFSLVDLALEGDQQAYRALFKRYWKGLLFEVSKLVPDKEEARDITMEAFSKAFFNLHRFSKSYCFNTWLYTIAINHGLDFIRKKRLPTTPLSTFTREDSCEVCVWGNDRDWQQKNPEEQIIQRQKEAVVKQCLYTLPETLRNVACLRFIDSYHYAEIADLLGLPLGTVKAQVHRARFLLQRSLRTYRNYS